LLTLKASDILALARGGRENRHLDFSSEQRPLERRTEMEAKNESTQGKGKFANYVRWFFVGAFGLIILFTVIMAAYRKFGG
jgi:hypothetical protein